MAIWLLIKNGSIIDEKEFPQPDNLNDDERVFNDYYNNVITHFRNTHHLPAGKTFIGGEEIRIEDDIYQIKIKQ